MYNEQAPPEQGPADYPPYEEESLAKKLTYHLEGFIPLILIIIIVVFAGASLGLWNIPFITKIGPLSMLILGTPSPGTMAILNNSEDLVRPQFFSPDYLVLSPKEVLAQFDVIMLDQTGEAAPLSLPRRAGEAISEWVKKGGKLLIIKNSGISRADAPDVIGWEAVLGDVSPVDCQRLKNGRPSCLEPTVVPTAEIWRVDYDHPIATFDVIPPIGTEAPLTITTFEVAPASGANQIAAIKDISSGKFYLGIVERQVLIGKSIYMNYDPSITPGVFQNILRYLK